MVGLGSDRTVVLKEEKEFFLSIVCEDIVRRQLSVNKKWHPTPVLLPGKSHVRRSLVGYSPCGHKELDMTEQLHFTSLKCKFRVFI